MGHGGGIEETTGSVAGTALAPPPLSINDSNQRTMVEVVARYSNAYELKSSMVGFPSQEVAALRGDAFPLPPHPPHPLPL